MQSLSRCPLAQGIHMSSLRSALCRGLVCLGRARLTSNPLKKCHRLISIPSHHSSLSYGSFHASSTLREEESSADNVSQPKVWVAYDPVTNSHVTTSSFHGGDSNSCRQNPKVGESPPERIGNPKVEHASIPRANSFDFERAAGGMGFPMKKIGKNKVQWVCENCGDSPSQWWGICPSCSAPGTIKWFPESESAGKKARGFEVSENATRAWLPKLQADIIPRKLVDVKKGIDPIGWRIPLFGIFGVEVARVLGGGLVPGSLILVGGDPGVGKSTLLLQIAAMLAEGSDFSKPAPVIYVSGEESIEQIGNRADRMRIGANELYLYSSTDVEDIVEKALSLSPRALVVDSIQTVYLKGVLGSAGNIQQVKECTSGFLRFAKQSNVPVLLIGHVTKTGDIAGPRVLEHIVDAVLYMEGEKYSSYRLLRTVKNRFGSTDELGVFQMSESGLKAVPNPSEIFLSVDNADSQHVAGQAIAVIIDGSRPFLIEIQALCSSGSSNVKKLVNGIEESRANMIFSVLMKQAGLKLQDISIFLNVVSGFKLKETAGDVAVAVAICSSLFESPIPADFAFIGEIGLGGELRMVPRVEKRVLTVSKLGYKRCIVPKSAEQSLNGLDLEGIHIMGCKNVKEVMHCVFPNA